MLSTTRNLFDALGGWGNRGRSARRFILVALVLWAGPAAAQSAAPPVHHTGWFHVMWGDAFGGAATARHVLIDQQGRWHRLEIAGALLDTLGGAHRLAGRRVTITGRPLAPPAPGASAIHVEAIQLE